ncbi:MAG: YggT family protein [bacterium]|nr:YggT family protein [bacterium]
MQQIVSVLYNVVYWLLLIRVFMSFFPTSKQNPIFQFVFSITEPFLAPIRQALGLIHLGGASIDLSPIVLIVLLDLIRRAVNYI